MTAFGEHLRREREMRGISLDEISSHTKIGTRFLRALEEEQFDLLPGGIFNKGYVRAYAKYVGIDEDLMLGEYLEAAGESAPPAPAAPQKHAIVRPTSANDEEPRSAFPLVPVLIVLFIIAGVAGGWRLYRQRIHDRQQSALSAPRISTSSAPAALDSKQPLPAAVAPQPASTSTNIVPAVSTATAGAAMNAPFEITVRARDRAWVSVKSDGKVLVKGVIQPAEVKTVHASNQVVFWTGNAGAVELSFNGKDVPLSGGDNDERVLVFNSRGVQPPSATR